MVVNPTGSSSIQMTMTSEVTTARRGRSVHSSESATLWRTLQHARRRATTSIPSHPLMSHICRFSAPKTCISET